jgi:hypothetical protein
MRGRFVHWRYEYPIRRRFSGEAQPSGRSAGGPWSALDPPDGLLVDVSAVASVQREAKQPISNALPVED